MPHGWIHGDGSPTQTGSAPLIGDLLRLHFQIVRYPDGRVWHYVNRCFACTLTGGEPRVAPGETLALDWFAPQALPADLVSLHRRRIEDALTGQSVPFIG